MDEAAPVDLAERRCQTDRNRQEAGQIGRFCLVLFDQPIQQFTPGSLRMRNARPSRCLSVSG